MNKHETHINQSSLEAADALHGATAQRLLDAQEKLNVRMAFSGPACRRRPRVNIEAFVPERRALAPVGEDAGLEDRLHHQIQKILAIMAILINEREADIAGMNDLLDIIHAMDRRFFEFAGDEIEKVMSGRAPAGVLMTAVQRYLEKTA